jgi:hypothetical protein
MTRASILLRKTLTKDDELPGSGPAMTGLAEGIDVLQGLNR